MFKKAIKWIDSDPKRLFLVDGFGGILSAFMLGVVLVKLEPIFGIPTTILYLLAAIPCFFVIYDFYCYKRKDGNLAPFLKGIAIMNLVYCLISISLAVIHYQVMTYLGWGYIIGEILILLVLVNVELRAARALNSNSQPTYLQ